MKLRKRDPGLGDWRVLEKEATAVEARLARHKALEDEAKQLQADLRAAEKKQEELVAAARARRSLATRPARSSSNACASSWRRPTSRTCAPTNALALPRSRTCTPSTRSPPRTSKSVAMARPRS
jgi:hypothetical protein